MDDVLLLTQFEGRTLPFEEWTHRAHVKVGYLYVQDHSFSEALHRMRTSLKAFNEVNADRAKVGYHETITRAFLILIAEAVRAAPGAYPSADAFCDAHPVLLDKHALRNFYTDPVLFSEDAKARFVEPDLEPLPEAPLNSVVHQCGEDQP